MSYFCLDAVNDAFLGTLDSPQLLGDPGLAGEWSPCLNMVPTGWSWSFFFAQIAHSAEVQTALDLPAGCLLVDRRPAPVLAPGVTLALPYCDNLTVATRLKALTAWGKGQAGRGYGPDHPGRIRETLGRSPHGY